MQDAKRLARGCEATENARGVRVPPADNFFIENAKFVISCHFRLYLAPITLRKRTIFQITIFYIFKLSYVDI